jgi:hypothetical protein
MAGKCLYQPCKCVITGLTSGYCSEYCEAQGRSQGSEQCDCGHEACDG